MTDQTITLTLKADGSGMVRVVGQTVDGVNKKLGEASRGTATWKAQLQQLANVAKVGFAALAAGAGAAAAGTVELVRRAAQSADQMAKLSRSTGIAVEDIGRLKFAASQSGADLDKLSIGIKTLARDAEGGGKFLAQLGVQATNSAGGIRPMNELLLDVADRFSKMEDGAEKAAIAQRLFGDSGVQLIPFLNQGREGIAALGDQAERLGLVIGGDTAAASERFNDAVAGLTATSQGFANTLLAELAPQLANYTENLLRSAEQSGAFKTAAEGVATALKVVALAVILVKNGLDAFIDTAIGAVQIIGRAFGGIGAIVSDVATSIRNALSAAFDLDKEGVQNAFAGIGKRLTSIMSETAADIAQQGRNIGTGWESAARDTADAIESIFGEIEPVTVQTNELTEATGRATRSQEDLAAETRRASEAARDADRALAAQERALQELARAADDARDSLRNMLDRQAAILGGPATAAALDYRDALLEIYAAEQVLAQQGELTAGRIAEIAQLRTQEAEIYQQRLTEINENTRRELTETDSIMLGVVDGWSRAIGDFATRNIKSFKDLFRAFKDIALQALRDVVAAFVRQRLTIGVGIGGTGGPALAGPGGLTGGGGGGGILGAVSGGLGAGFGGLLGTAGALLGGTSTAFGTGLLASGSIFSGAGLLGGITGSISAGMASIAGGSILQGVGMLMGPVGLIVGAVSALVSIFKKDKPPDLRFGGENARVRKVEGSFDTVFGTVRAGSRQLSYEQLIEPIQQFDQGIQQLVLAVGGGAGQLDAIRARLSTWSVDLRGSAATAENVLGSRFSAILETFSQDVQQFVGATGTVEERIKRLAEALQIEQLVELGDLGDTFAEVSALLLDYRNGTEDLAQTYARLVAGAELLEGALDLAGQSFEGTRDELVRFAADIVDAAGGLQQAQALWSNYFETFYSEQERQQLAIDRARSSASTAFGAIGLNLDDFTGAGGAADFRRLFEEALPNLSAEAVVQWLRAASALGILIDATGQVADVAGEAGTQIGEVASNLGDLMAGVDEELERYAPPATFAERIAAVNERIEGMIEAATRMGASEEQLARIRQLGAAQLDEIAAAQRAALGEYEAFVAQFRDDGGGISSFQQRLRDIQREAADAVTAANRLAQAAGLAGASAEDLAAIQARAARLAADAALELEASILSLAEQLGYFAEVSEQANDVIGSDLGFVQWLERQRQAVAEAPEIDPQRFGSAVALAGQIRELAEFVGDSVLDTIARLSIPLDRLVQDFGVNLDQLGDSEVFDRFVQASRALGLELSEAAGALGVEIGSLADASSQINDAFERAIAGLGSDAQAALLPLLSQYESATTPEGRAAARQALVDAVDELPPALRAALAPFLDEIDTSSIEEQQLSAAEQTNRYLSAAEAHLAAIRAALERGDGLKPATIAAVKSTAEDQMLREVRGISGKVDRVADELVRFGNRILTGANVG